MAERGKRQDLTDPAAQRRENRRRRAINEENAAQEDKRFTVLGLLRAVVVAAGVVAAGEAHRAHCPQEREPIYEPKRLPWALHEADLDKRRGWRRSYRMEKSSFHKLVELLRPSLEVNAFFGALRSPRNGAIAVEVRVAVALRILAGASYWDVLLMFGLSVAVTYQILWEVIDAINNTPAVGAFDFPLTEEGCMRNANRFKDKNTDGIFSRVVAAVDGLFIKAKAPCEKETKNVVHYYSGSKSAYGINVQAMCTADHRFCAMSTISPGSTNDCVAWNRSSLAKAVARLPAGFHIIGDAAYPIGEKLLTPYPAREATAGGRGLVQLPPEPASCKIRVKIEQSFGILVSTWGILWRPLRVQLGGRADLITALFHLHNFLQDEKLAPIQLSEEDSRSGLDRPAHCATQRTLPPDGWGTEPASSRSGETPARAAIRKAL